MKSDFEQRAAREAVEAVERRYERTQKAARQMRGRARIGRIVIVAALVIGGYAVYQNFFGDGTLSFSSLPSLSSFFDPGSSSSIAQRGYGNALKFLLTGEVKLSSEMPNELQLKTARPGVKYTVLTAPAADWFELYELTRGEPGSGIAISELSPVRSPRHVKAADMRAAIAGKPYLVAVQGAVYLFGSKNLSDATNLRSQVQALVGAMRQAK